MIVFDDKSSTLEIKDDRDIDKRNLNWNKVFFCLKVFLRSTHIKKLINKNLVSLQQFITSYKLNILLKHGRSSRNSAGYKTCYVG